MAHKVLQETGTEALCSGVKDIRHTVEAAADAVVAISDNLSGLASETEDALNEIDTDITNLTNAILAGVVSTPLGNRSKVGIATRSGTEIYALRNL